MNKWLGDAVRWAEGAVGTPLRFAVSLFGFLLFTGYVVFQTSERGWQSAWVSIVVLLLYQFYFAYGLYRLAAVHRQGLASVFRPAA